MMRIWALLAALLVSASALAQGAAPVLGPAAGGTGGNPINALAWANVYRDTQRAYGSVTINSGSAALYCANCSFTQADAAANKFIFVQGAGVTAATGAVSAVPVISGGSYTVQPDIAFTGASLTPATGQPVAKLLMGLSSAAINTAGVGCTNGLAQIATLKPFGSQGGYLSGLVTPPTVSVTVSGGIVTAINSISNPGVAWNIDAFGPTGVQFSLAGCSSEPSFNITFAVASVSILTGGWGNSLTPGAITASAASGTYSSVAVLGTVSVAPGVAPLFAQIATYVDAHDVTLSAIAATAVGGNAYVKWGHDDGAGLQAAMNAICAGATTTSQPKTLAGLFLPGNGGEYGLASNLTIPLNCNLNLYGSGNDVTTIDVLASLGVNSTVYAASVAAHGSASSLSSALATLNGIGTVTISHLSIDADHGAAIPLWLWGSHRTEIDDVAIYNPTPGVAGAAGLVVGDPAVYNYSQGVNAENLYVRDTIGLNSSDLMLQGIAAYDVDSSFGGNIYVVNAAYVGINDAQDNPIGASHVFGSQNQSPEYGYIFGRAPSFRAQPDGAAVAGLLITGSSSPVAVQCTWGGYNQFPTSSTYCVQIASGLNGVNIAGLTTGLAGFNAANMVNQIGNAGTTNPPTWTLPQGAFNGVPVPSQVFVPQGSCAIPSLSGIGLFETGIYWDSTPAIYLCASGTLVSEWRNGYTQITGQAYNNLSQGWALQAINGNIAGTPNILPNRNDVKAGFGAAAAGDADMIADVSGTGTAIIRADTNGYADIFAPIVQSPVTISALPTCNSGIAGHRRMVSNGVATPAYQGAVSTTGTTTQPVFCNGSGWVYD